MKKFLIVTFSFLFSVSFVQAGSDCYVVTEDALAADSEVTWEVANAMLKNQEMEKLTRLMLDGRIIVIKPGEKLRIMTLGKALNEVTKENDEKKWFISIEVARPCSK
ncbi:MAG: hypothetical protein V1897_15405 [Pseudomonadota bacterium]